MLGYSEETQPPKLAVFLVKKSRKPGTTNTPRNPLLLSSVTEKKKESISTCPLILVNIETFMNARIGHTLV